MINETSECKNIVEDSWRSLRSQGDLLRLLLRFLTTNFRMHTLKMIELRSRSNN